MYHRKPPSIPNDWHIFWLLVIAVIMFVQYCCVAQGGDRFDACYLTRLSPATAAADRFDADCLRRLQPVTASGDRFDCAALDRLNPIQVVSTAPLEEREIAPLIAKPVEPKKPNRPVVTMYSPRWCANCPAWQQRLGSGDNDVLIEVVKSNAPTPTPRYPALFYEGKLLHDWNYCPTLDEIKQKLRAPNPDQMTLRASP